MQNRDLIVSKPTIGVPTFFIPEMKDATYRLQFCNTRTGVMTDGGSVSTIRGSLTILVRNLTDDVAIKTLPVSLR